jgi:hypothetical protein
MDSYLPEELSDNLRHKIRRGIKPMVSEQVYTHILTVSVPPDTKWHPSTSIEFTTQLINGVDTLDLLITAQAGKIDWRVQVPHFTVDFIKGLIHAYYPNTHVEITPKQKTHIGYYYYPLEASLDFFMPFKYAPNSKDIDPLLGIVGSLARVQAGEEIIYELSVSRPSKNYRVAYEDLFKLSTGAKILGFALDAALVSMNKGRIPPSYFRPKSMEQRRQEKEVLELDKMARDKLSLQLSEVKASLKIKASSENRAHSLADAIITTTSSFDSFNWLQYASDNTHPIVVSTQELAAFWHFPTEAMKKTKAIGWLKAKTAPIPAELLRETEGVQLGVNDYQGEMQPARLPYDSRKTHVNIVGMTGTGKSTLIQNMIHQDIQAGLGVGLIDPHGKLVNDVLATCIPEERIPDVILFDTNDQEYSIGLNPLAIPLGGSAEKVTNQALEIIKRLFEGDWLGGRMERDLYMALRALVDSPGTTLLDIEDLFVDPSFQAKILSNISYLRTKQNWERFLRLSQAQQDQRLEPILNRVDKFYRNERLMRIICQPDSLNFREVIDGQKIFLANLGGMEDGEIAIIGSLLMSKIHMGAVSRGEVAEEDYRRFYLYVDEVQRFVTTSLPAMYSEARKFGLSLTTANQFLSQLSGKTWLAMEGNVGASIIFRVGDKDAAELRSLVKDNFGNDDLENLSNHHAIVKIRAGNQTLESFSILTQSPPPKADNAEEIVARILSNSRKTYGRIKDDLEVDNAEQQSGEAEPDNKESYFG